VAIVCRRSWKRTAGLWWPRLSSLVSPARISSGTQWLSQNRGAWISPPRWAVKTRPRVPGPLSSRQGRTACGIPSLCFRSLATVWSVSLIRRRDPPSSRARTALPDTSLSFGGASRPCRPNALRQSS
jgi:hypothetical protein